MKADTIKNRDDSAGFRVQQELQGGRKGTIWKWRCIAKDRFIGDQRKWFETKAEALDHALAWKAESMERKVKKQKLQKDPKELAKLATAQTKIDNFNIKEWDDDSKIGGIRGETWNKLDVEKCVDIGIQVCRTIQELNSKKEGQGYSLTWALGLIRKNAFQDLKDENRKTFQFAIDNFMQFKLSKVGGKGRRPLALDSKREWKFHIENLLSSWIGDRKIRDSKDLNFERNLIIKKIDSMESWGQLSKKRSAQKIKEFGGWMAARNQNLIDENPFLELPSEYDYKVTKSKTYYKNSDVIELFKIAASDDKKYPYCFSNLIPFLSLAFFAGLRPAEIAKDEDSERRFEWKDLDVENPFTKTKGIPVFVPAEKSKQSFDRNAELSANGLAWIQLWAEKHNNGIIPRDGQIFYSKNTLNRLKEAWGKWKQDTARHTYCSSAREAFLDQGIDSGYWVDRTGHSDSTFKRFYATAPSERDAKNYFSITPEILKQ